MQLGPLLRIFLPLLVGLASATAGGLGKPAWAAEEAKSAALQSEAPRRETPSGLPVPRFASLKVERVNVRQGPSTDSAVSWVYTRKGWPVEIIAEQDVWRRIKDKDGQMGWVHTKLLDGTRTALLQGADILAIRSKPEPAARPVAWAEPGVLVWLRKCDEAWCEVQGDDKGVRGYMQRTALWGLLPGETIE